jgi:hypothetical protein
MMRRMMLLASAALSLALAPAPAVAQDDEAAQAAVADAFADLASAFEVEPLTPEQEARLPAARRVVERVLPDGTMAEMMGSMFDGLLGQSGALGQADATSALEEALGYPGISYGLDEATAAAALAIVDPGWQERSTASARASQELTATMMSRMEPVMRNVMAELYAIHFDDAQLRDIEAFFATDSGATYARESYRMASDPRIMAAVFSNPDIMFGTMTDSIAAMEAAAAAVPPRRTYGQLSASERNRLTQLTGLSKTELEEYMGYTASLSGAE